MNELTTAPPLLVEAAQELNEAYATAQPLEVMLDRHRRLALECAPLSERIAVMRALEVADPTSAFWDADIRAHETACIKRLKADATAAIKQRDHAGISRVLAELDAGGWRVEPPPEFRTALQKADSTLSQQETFHQVRLMMRDLDLAYGAMDLAAVTNGVRAIRGMLAPSNLSLPPELNARLISAEQWSRQQTESARRNMEIDQAVNQLSESVSANAPFVELELLRSRVMDLGAEVPEEAEQRVASLRKKRDAEIASKARRRMALVAVSAAAVLAASALAVRGLIRNSRGTEALALVSQHYNSGDLDAADADLKRFAIETPYVLDRADIKDVATRLGDSRQAEKDRLAQYQSAVSDARVAIDNATKAGGAGDATWAPAESATSAATSLAKLPGEMLKVRQLRDEIASTRNRIEDVLRDKQQRELRQSVADLQAQADSFEAAARKATLAPDDAALQASIKRASLLVSSIPDNNQTSQIHSDAQLVLSRLTSAVEAADRQRAQATRTKSEQIELENVRSSTATPVALKEALAQFVRRCPNSSHSARFEKDLARVAEWASVDEAARLMTSWDTKLDVTPSAVPGRLAAIAAYTAKYTNSPWASGFADYASYLKLLQTATGDRGPWKGDFRAELNQPILKDLLCMKSADGKRYYLSSSEVPTHDSVGTTFNYIARGGAIKRVHGNFAGKPAASPQSTLCKELGTAIDGMGRDWETLGYSLTDRIAESKDVDPILRVILLEHALNAWQVASSGGDDALLAIAGALGRFNADDLAWMDPEDADANAKRDAAEQLLAKQVPQLKKALDAIVTRRDDLLGRLQLRVVGHGALLTEPSAWTILTMDKPEPGSPAFAVTSHGWSRVAEFQGGRFAVDGKAVEEDLDGSMVFILPSPAPASRPAARAAGK
jgi:hypothetical protein